MKKTFLTIVAVGFGVSVSFAQGTAPMQGTETEQGVQTEQNDMYQKEEGKEEVAMSELPSAVQEAFKNGQYSNHQVLTIYEKEGDEGTKYAFELAENMGEQETATEEAMPGLETERVSERQPDVIVYFDEQGTVLEEKDPEEKHQNKEEKLDSEY